MTEAAQEQRPFAQNPRPSLFTSAAMGRCKPSYLCAQQDSTEDAVTCFLSCFSFFFLQFLTEAPFMASSLFCTSYLFVSRLAAWLAGVPVSDTRGEL